jgi:hypothetical protein
MNPLSEIERTIEAGFRRFTERAFGPAQSDDLVLVHRAVLEQVTGKIQVAARGRRVFPYPRVIATFVSPDPDRRALYQAAFGEKLEAALREALEGSNCEVLRGFAVQVHTAEAGVQPFSIEYDYNRPLPAASAPARLTVIRGKAQQSEYTLERPRTNIGRMAEVTDAEQRVLRRNDIVFDEGVDEANATVSRKHAHVTYEAGEYRLCDDASEFGTRVFRDGRSLDVPTGNRRGEKLKPGDEIYLGRACLKFER